MIRLFSFTLVFLIFIINISFAQKPLTLQETIDIAIKNNIEVAQTGLAAEGVNKEDDFNSLSVNSLKAGRHD